MKVEIKYECGHYSKFDSPSVRDPLGHYCFYVATGKAALCPDDVLRIADNWKCCDCIVAVPEGNE